MTVSQIIHPRFHSQSQPVSNCTGQTNKKTTQCPLEGPSHRAERGWDGVGVKLCPGPAANPLAHQRPAA